MPTPSKIYPGAEITHGTAVYEIGEMLDKGGFGIVYTAQRTKPSLKSLVVKVPAANVLDSPIDSQKFEREAQILANIHHVNVVQIVAFWKFSNGEMALVQELVEGAQKLRQYITANLECAPSVLVQSLYAMRAFHTGAIHRDISPSNILINNRGVVKVIDFGLAREDPRVGETLTVTGDWFGTIGCIAPEQVHDAKNVDHRADLYALGRSMTAALQNISPQFANPSTLPEPWQTICSNLTAIRADDRYPTADAALNDALELFSAAGILLANFDVHVAEMASASQPPSWPAACSLYFLRLPDIDQQAIKLASELKAEAFGSGFGAKLFDKVEGSSAVKAFESRTVSFEDCDPLGKLYGDLYNHLDYKRRQRCFRRLCQVAVGWHRYAVMSRVRSVYAQERNTALKKDLLDILEEEDPNRRIHGKGQIPGRTP